MRSLKISKANHGYDTKGELREGLLLQKRYSCQLLGFATPIADDQKEGISLKVNGKTIKENELKIDFLAKKKELDPLEFQIEIISPLYQGSTILLEVVFDDTQFAKAGKIKPMKISLWVHYAFRWFRRPQIVNEIVERRTYPWKISQRSTSLCGIACIFYFLIQDDPDTYERLIFRLHQYGYAHHNNYLIVPNAYLHKINPEKDPEYPKGMAYVDWIALASVRNMESRLGYRGKVDQVASAINWPHIMIKLGRNLLGYENTKFKLFSPIKTYIRDYFKDDKKLKILAEEVDKSYHEGAKLILLIDSDMLHNLSRYHLKNYIQYHWVAYEGGLRLTDKDGKPTSDYASVDTLKFDTFSWGEEIKHSRTSNGISRNAFIRNYYGYIRIN